MSDEHGPGVQRWSVPSFRRVTDFFLTIGQLERSYQSLKADNEKLNRRFAEIDKVVSEQSGQLKVLMTFVQAALEKQVEGIAAKAVDKRLDQLISSKSDRSDSDS